MNEGYTNIKYELVPYDNFVGSDAFDFDKTIYDLNSQIELLSSQADNLDYIVAVASGIACSILDILWKSYGTDVNGMFLVVDVLEKSKPFIGKDVPQKILMGTITWYIFITLSFQIVQWNTHDAA